MSSEAPTVMTTRLLAPALLALACALAFAVRLFPVAKWGSVIHEFDPHFNYRVTRLLHAHGASALRDWFDDRAWFPLGRSVGETVYPGLMLAAVGLQWVAGTLFRMPISTRVACVFVAPVFAAFACLAIYALTLQVTKRQATALTAAALFAMSPAYISRSTAGSFDNEGVAIFLLVATFWLWIRAVETGTMFTAGLTALFYFAMVVSWGGYVFIINLIPLHVLALVASGRYSPRVYIAYSTFYPLATLLAMQVPFVGFNAITNAETAGSHAVFAGLQAFAAARWFQSKLSTDEFKKLLHGVLVVGGVVAGVGFVGAMALGKLQWTGRSLTLLDPTYASKYIPIIASVGEHQPTPWATIFLSLGPIVVLAPLGIIYSFEKLDDAHLFMILYAAFSFYFAGIMVRLLLTLAPAACFLSALGLSRLMTTLIAITKDQQYDEEDIVAAAKPESASEQSDAKVAAEAPVSSIKRKKALPPATAAPPPPLSSAVLALEKKRLLEERRRAYQSFWGDWGSAFLNRLSGSASSNVPAKSLSSFLWLLILALGVLLLAHMHHCMKVSHIAYSSTSMVHESRDPATRTRYVHDDYREAYAWLRSNAEPDAKILGWWDYGYQLSALANRTVIVDNNTWNNTHIATVGRVLTSPEAEAWPILQSLQVDYIFILFGGRIGMHGDDLDKMPWILRISQDVFREEIIENEFTVNGQYVFDCENATSAMQQSLLYKMSYYRFFDKPASDADEGAPLQTAVDKTRSGNPKIDASGIRFEHIEEAYTSDAWIVRIYRVKR